MSILQKYMPGRRALEVIEESAFYFRAISQYPDDPDEGVKDYFLGKETIIENVNEYLARQLGKSIEEVKAITFGEMPRLLTLLKFERDTHFSQSWYAGYDVLESMWSEYGGFNKTTSRNSVLFVVDKMSYISNLYDVVGGSIRMNVVGYVDDKAQQTEAFFTKNKKFSHEEEYRFLIDFTALMLANPNLMWNLNEPETGTVIGLDDDSLLPYRVSADNFISKDKNGFSVKVNLERVLVAVLVPDSADESFKKELTDALSTKGWEGELLEWNGHNGRLNPNKSKAEFKVTK